MIDKFLVAENASIRDALAVIDGNAHGTAFVVDDHGIMTGLLTDGDVRRALLADAVLETLCVDVMVREFLSLPVSTRAEDLFAALDERVHIIPLLDDSRRPVDFATTSRLKTIPVSEPVLAGNEFDYLMDCLKTNWISSKGQYISRFEEAFAAYIDSPNAVVVSSGTAALHLALLAFDIGPGDEVIVPNLTFAASAAAVVYTGARPVLVDVSVDDWNLDLAQAERLISPRTKAIMPVHLYGMPVDMTPLVDMAASHGLHVIEDAAEGIGTFVHGQHAGTIGDAGCFSFFGNKLITTGEGGMVVCADAARAARIRRLRDHGMNPDRRYWHDEIGFNYRMTNMQAAIGLAQVERIEDVVKRKHRISELYREALMMIPGLTLPPEPRDGINSHWAFTILVDDAVAGLSRDELVSKLQSNGIETRPVFYPLNEMPPFAAFGDQRLFPVSKRLSQTGLSLPSSLAVTDESISQVCDVVRRNLSARELLVDLGRHVGAATEPS